ncbi:hypothetical protein ABVK25_000914 [Lepraria finkii]|uniref:Uncharacterized protein n=1 Tax=Lepraria finkii TaxID=1340010 RepID=A0ABR4BP86_9LECA
MNLMAWRLSVLPSLRPRHPRTLPFSTFSERAMIATKRRRESSVAATPTLSYNNGLHSSSVAQSPPTRHLQQARSSQQNPTKRVSPRPPRSRLSSVAPSSQPRAAHRHSRLASTAPSADSVRPENEAEGEEREQSDHLDEVVMAVEMRNRGTVGCAYYLPREQKLYMVSQ